MRALSTLVVSSALLVSAEARAQSEQDVLLTTTTTAAVLVPITTTVGAIATLIALTGGSDDPGKMDGDSEDDTFKGLEVYLRQNELQLAQDLARGGGPIIDELAQALQLSDEGARRFALLLQEDRAALLELAEVDRLNTARAAAFARRLHALLTSHPDLAAEVERFAAAHRGG